MNIADITITSLETVTAFDITTGAYKFVLDELRHIADSSDTLRRNRGRGGLDCLNTLHNISLYNHLPHGLNQ